MFNNEFFLDRFLLKFMILLSLSFLRFKMDDFLDKLSIEIILHFFIFFFKKTAILEPIKPQPPGINICIL